MYGQCVPGGGAPCVRGPPAGAGAAAGAADAGAYSPLSGRPAPEPARRPGGHVRAGARHAPTAPRTGEDAETAPSARWTQAGAARTCWNLELGKKLTYLGFPRELS